MALDKVLKVYDDNGNEIDYDILAKDVKFLPDGKDLPTKLAELEDEIGEGGYAPPQGGIPKSDLAQDVQDSLDKADSALQEEDVADFATKTELQQGLGGKQDKISAGNGIVIAQDGKTVSVDASIRTNAGKGVADVSSPQEDGSFTIELANGDTYTVNLNHQHTQYQPLLTSANAGSNITITTDQQTGNIIISAAGGGGGSITIDPSITGANQANPVAGGAIYTALQAKANANEMSIVDVSNDTTRKNIQLKSGLSATVVTQHQSLAGRVQSNDVASIVKISQAAYDALQTKDSSTLYLITES